MPVECARIAPLDSDCDHTIKFVVIFARYQGQWLFVRERTRDTWETAGGHIDPGESPDIAAKRELFEEAGVRDADIRPLFDYWAYDGKGSAWGRVFIARAHSLEEIPKEFEMAERMLTDALPDRLTYPYIVKKLFPVVEKECERLALL